MKKKALITGINGFVGTYLRDLLISQGYEVFGIDKTDGGNIFVGDITNAGFVEGVLVEVMPDEIYHLAGFSSVKQSFDDPDLVMAVNVEGTRNLLEGARRFCGGAKVLVVTSAEVYGKPEKVPISEDEALKETSPYSKSRIVQEGVVGELDDLDVVISRSFNHTGPGQSTTFVLPDFSSQAIEIEAGDREPVIYTGNLSVVRDFSDVRDVVKAYHLLLQKGKKGEAYNVGSGKGYVLQELLEKIILKVDKKIKIETDQEKIRPIEIPELIADTKKVKMLGWSPEYSMDETLTDLLNYFRNKL